MNHSIRVKEHIKIDMTANFKDVWRVLFMFEMFKMLPFQPTTFTYSFQEYIHHNDFVHFSLIFTSGFRETTSPSLFYSTTVIHMWGAVFIIRGKVSV